jgi:hypothetical protein
MKKNITEFIIVNDTLNNTRIIFDNINMCSDEFNISYGVILNNIKKKRLYKNRWIFEYGDTHEKKIKVEFLFSPILMRELKKIYTSVPNCNIVKLTNTICSDYVFMMNEENKKI